MECRFYNVLACSINEQFFDLILFYEKYEVVVEDENAILLTELLQSLPYVKEVKLMDVMDAYTLASESSLSEDWLAEDDEELQRMYKK